MNITKMLRKSLCLLLALSMLLSMGAGVFATDSKDVATRASIPGLSSTKTLYTDANTADDLFRIVIDAQQDGVKSVTSEGVPLDIAIVFDRSQSMSQPSTLNAADYKAFKSYYPASRASTYDRTKMTISTNIQTQINALNTYLNTLDKTKYEGYYRATNILKRNAAYFLDNHEGWAAEGFASWEPMRYNTSTKQWEMRITVGEWTSDFPGGINTMDFTTGSIANKQVQWISVVEGYKEYLCRQERHIYRGFMKDYGDFAIITPRLTKAINATESFIDAIEENSKTLPEGQSHRVSILSFGGGVFIQGGKYDYKQYIASSDSAETLVGTLKDELNVSIPMTSVATGMDQIKSTLRGHYTYTVTHTDYAMEELATNTSYLPKAEAGRKRVVVFITDGLPTGQDNMEVSVMNAALADAKVIKDDGVEIYSIGFMHDLNDTNKPTTVTGKDPNSGSNADTFLKAVSSYYPEATQVSYVEYYFKDTKNTSSTSDDTYFYTTDFEYYDNKTRYTYQSGKDRVVNGDLGDQATTSKPYYKADDGTGDKLEAIFATMLESILTVDYTASYSGEYLTIYDEITREFMLDSSRPIEVKVEPYNTNGGFDAAVTVGTHSFTAPTGSTPVNLSGKGYNISLSLDSANSISKVQLNWTDAKYGFLTPEDFDQRGAYPEYKRGYRILLSLPLVVNRDNTAGGNNINTNTSASGLYKDSAAGATVLGEKLITYPIPNANVTFGTTAQVYDYFVDLQEYISKLRNPNLSGSDAQAIFEDMYTSIGNYMTFVQNHRNDYLNFDLSLYNSLQQLLDGYYANAGATSFTGKNPASGASFDFLVDQVLKFVLTLTPKTSNRDSCADVTNGVAPYSAQTITLAPNYYGPKYVVVDFDETVKTPLDKESGLNPTLQSGQKNGKIENGNICFDLRKTYASGNKSFLETTYTTVKYQVTPINGTKAQGTASTVARNFYVIPANVMTYDDTMLTFDSNGWETIGTYTDSVQTYDNALIHGYDSIYNSTYSATYYHNAQKGVTVSKDKGTAQATFTIKGTGFDIFSMTSPNSGMMAVEVSTDSSYKNDVRTFIVDTYLADQTLYQVPVVRCDDLDYGTYYIRITAFYDSIFDHNYVSKWKNGVITEERLRERYGIAEDADFTFIPSASGYDQPATRIANAANGQYNVYVDGIRVYNTVDSLTANAVCNFAYAQAGEGVANITNINDALVDADNADQWKQGQANGVLYMAAGKTTADQDDVTNGIILGMEGSLYTKADGAKFYVYKDAACTIPVTYNGGNVYYRKTTTTSPKGREFSGLNYFYDGGSAKDPMTRNQVVEAFGAMPTYYNSSYSAMGPEKEVYLNGSNGVAFKVGTGASKVMLSLKSHNGSKATVKIYDHSTSKFVTLAETTSRVEMYYDITKYVNSTTGYVYIANGGGISAICNLKVIGTAMKSVTIDAGLAEEAARIFKLAGLPVDESAKIMHSLDLKSDIALNYVVPTAKLTEYDSCYMTVEFNGGNYVLTPEIRGAYGYFTLNGINAVEMTEELRATLHLFLGEEEFLSETDVYCVADYAYAQLNKAETSAELKAICANLLRYGAEAQTYKAYNTDKLADAAMTEEQKSYLTDLEAVVLENKAQAMGDVEGTALWAGKALVLDTKVTVKTVFDLSAFEGDVEALNLRVSYTNCAGQLCTLAVTEVEVYNAEKALYSFNVDTLDAADLRSVLTMALYEGETQISETQLYSAESYCAGKIGALGNVCKALMAYSDAANAYFAK